MKKEQKIPSAAASVTTQNSSKQQYGWFLPFLAVSAVIFLILYATKNWDLWVSHGKIQTTNNATIKADLTFLNAPMNGVVKEIRIADFHTVQKGEVIAKLEDSTYQAVVSQAEAKLAVAKAELSILQQEHQLQQASTTQLTAGSSKSTTAQQYSQELRDDQEGRVRDSGTTLKYLPHQSALLQAKMQQRAAQLKEAEAQLQLAKLALQGTEIRAPVSGKLGKSRVHPGSYLAIGSQVNSIVPADQVYILANYKENQLANMTVGQSVQIWVDAFPGQQFFGRVVSIAPASSSEYALLPAESATGNFTKMVQRIPVRIELLPNQPLLERLLPGMSVVTSVDTSSS